MTSESCEDGARGCPDGVGGVESTGQVRWSIGQAGCPSDGHGERRAECHRRHEQQQQAGNQADHDKRQAALTVLVGRHEERRQGAKLVGQCHSQDRRHELEPRIGSKGLARRQARGDPAASDSPQSEAAHERGKHGTRRGQAMAHGQRQHPAPAHFVDETGHPRTRIRRENEPERH